MRRRVLFVPVAVVALLAAALPAHAGAYCSEPDQFQDRATNQVVMKGDCFGPTVARIEAGDSLTFRNIDVGPHTVGGVASSFGEAHKEIPQGETVTFRFDEEGVYPFFCVLHSGMTGAVVVGDGVGTGTAGAVAAPVEQGGALDEQATSAARRGVPGAMLAAVAILALTLGLVTAAVAVRRRRAIDTA